MAAHNNPAGYLLNSVIHTGGLPFYTPSTSSKKLLNNNTRDPKRMWTSSEKYFSLSLLDLYRIPVLGSGAHISETNHPKFCLWTGLPLLVASFFPWRFKGNTTYNSPASLSHVSLQDISWSLSFCVSNAHSSRPGLQSWLAEQQLLKSNCDIRAGV